MKTTIKTLVLALVLTMSAAYAAIAQEETAPATTTTASEEKTATETALAEEPAARYDAGATQRAFDDILRRHPHEVGMVLKLDPSLFRNESWLATYPEIRAFAQEHPEVAQNPAPYLENVQIERSYVPDPPHVRAFNQAMEGVMILLVMSVIVSALIWLIRTLLQHRRWSRSVFVHTQLQNKLLDRLTQHDELLRYLESGAGRDLMPKPELPPSTPSPVAAPINRILWSVQAGVVVLFLGLGLEILGFMTHPDVRGAYAALGTMALAVGIGFIVSSLVGWTLARKLGLWEKNEAGATNGLPTRTLTEER